MLRAGKMPCENRLIAALLVLQRLLILVWVLVLLLLWGHVLLLLLVWVKHLLTVLRMLEIRRNLALQLKVTLAVVMVADVLGRIRRVRLGVGRWNRPNGRVRLSVAVVIAEVKLLVGASDDKRFASKLALVL
jgi:hypothetical protein